MMNGLTNKLPTISSYVFVSQEILFCVRSHFFKTKSLRNNSPQHLKQWLNPKKMLKNVEAADSAEKI